MHVPTITPEWVSTIATLMTAVVAVFAAVYAKRAAEAGAKAAAEAAKQVRELHMQREPGATFLLRIPGQLTGEQQINYGRGNQQYRSGTPVFLDVWNISGPTIMIMEVSVALLEVNGVKCGDPPESINQTLAPQSLIESGKVQSINVAYSLMRQVSYSVNEEHINMPSGTTASAQFTVKYISINGEHIMRHDCAFRFGVTDNNIFTFAGEQRQLSGSWATYHFPNERKTKP